MQSGFHGLFINRNVPFKLVALKTVKYNIKGRFREYIYTCLFFEVIRDV